MLMTPKVANGRQRSSGFGLILAAAAATVLHWTSIILTMVFSPRPPDFSRPDPQIRETATAAA
jgi:hypothetical protein